MGTSNAVQLHWPEMARTVAARPARGANGGMIPRPSHAERATLREAEASPSKPLQVDPSALEALVARMAHKDEEALASFYDASVSRVYGLALRIVRCAAEAEEVCIDTFHQAWRDSGRYDRTRGSPLAWLLTICRSRALDLLRAREPAVAHEDPHTLRSAEDAGCDDDPQDLLVATQSTAVLGVALARLAPSQRQMLALAFFRGLTHEEIAAHSKLPLGTVKSQVRRALAALRRDLIQGDA